MPRKQPDLGSKNNGWKVSLISVLLSFNYATGCAFARKVAYVTEGFSNDQVKIAFDYSRVSNFLKEPEQTSQCNSNERKSLLKLIEEVRQLSPDLLKAACLDRTLLFLKTGTGIGSDAKAKAWALPGIIAVSDEFFADPQRLRCLIHELTHCADLGQEVSRSSDWLQIAVPLIEKVKFRASLLDTNLKADFESALIERQIWPSLYASTDVEEALAEYIAWHIVVRKQDSSIDPNFIRIYRALVSPTKSTTELKMAELAFARQSYEKARSYYLHCKSFSSGRIECRLCRCELLRGNHRSAMKYAVQAIAMMRERKIPPNDPAYLEILKEEAYLQAIAGHMDEAKKIIDDVLILNPIDLGSRDQRLAFEQRLGLAEDCKKDQFLLSHPSELFPINAFSCYEDWSFTQDLFDLLITSTGDGRYKVIRDKLFAEVAVLERFHPNLINFDSQVVKNESILKRGKWDEFEVATAFPGRELSPELNGLNSRFISASDVEASNKNVPTMLRINLPGMEVQQFVFEMRHQMISKEALFNLLLSNLLPHEEGKDGDGFVTKPSPPVTVK